MKISDHFTLAELTKSSTAMRHSIANTPDQMHIKNMALLCAGILEPCRKHFKRPFVPSSVFRNQEVNKLAGSNSTSQHTKGQAADFEIPGVDNYEVAVWVANNLLFDQLILEHYTPGQLNSGWIHVSLCALGNRESTLTYSGVLYIPGLKR